MTNKINMDELLADRKSGTEGPWRVRENDRHSPEECDLTICGDIWRLADINGPQYKHQEANASRIARLPDLEVAYIEAVRALEAIANNTMGENLTKLDLEKFARVTLEKISG